MHSYSGFCDECDDVCQQPQLVSGAEPTYLKGISASLVGDAMDKHEHHLVRIERPKNETWATLFCVTCGNGKILELDE